MDINKYITNNQLTIRVIPNSSKLRLVEQDQKLKLYLTSPAEKGKANSQLIKFFKKELNLKVIIISGERSKEKVLKLFQ